MASWKCTICGYIYTESEPSTATPFQELPDTWRCPVCNAGKDAFKEIRETDIHASASETVSDVIIAELAAWGVNLIFGLPGTSSLGLVDAVRKNDDVRYIVVRHEENAAMAASAYNKLTGNIAACLTIAGPGATNCATGLYDAKEDHASLICINGQVEAQYSGPGGIQEIDQDAFFRPVSVYNNTIYDRDKTILLLTRALKYAKLRHGVAQLSVPNNIQKLPLEAKNIKKERCSEASILPEREIITKAAAIIEGAENPVVIAGWGAYEYADDVAVFAETCSAPIITTFRAKGLLPDTHPWNLGILGNVGSPAAREWVNEADLIITLGVGFSKYTNVPLTKPIIQVDIDPVKLGVSPETTPLWGDIHQVLAALLPLLKKRSTDHTKEKIASRKREWYAIRDTEADATKKPIRPPFIMKVLSEVIPEDAVISLDVGENQWWFGRNFRMKRQRFAMSGYLATMGFGLPGAIAAKLAYPDKAVFCITGDGGFSMAMGDFVTAVKYHLPIVVIILNNHELGMIQVEQMMEQYPNYATDLHNPDFAAYAEACGGIGIHVEEPEMLRTAVSGAINSTRPTIIDIETDPVRFYR
ncbi:thiamine pyrophosphate-dependent enzyme [Methanogenium organophilum]|uniref:Thiamine pyrophosphate-binding protein n=1 Tax=Methanogenium organophilum TaxID=2199 RepID=A0A9X9T795_METOG|nr:thiamine pyrophosphate-dependent enzyme [Methanogenium organophilum]WAI00819.1 thiamine pyrophosphate-binding protein [Methanogenium organophilum]